jgi:ribose 1,5-bisphosphokinase
MPGKLIYLMGPSGAGKDSLIDAARPALALAGVSVARRVITRSAESLGEQAEGVTPEAFETRVKAGGFALSWQANGLDYGIDIDIDQQLQRGEHVLVNGSRAYLPEAVRRYPDLIAIGVTVNSEVLRDRLIKRGRESLADIELRLARNTWLALQEGAEDGFRGQVAYVDNSGRLDSAVAQLLGILADRRVSAAADRT